MKKQLLLSVALAATCSAFASTPSIVKADKHIFNVGPSVQASENKLTTRGDKYIDFSYAEEPYSQISLNGTTAGKTRVYMCFEMTPEDIKSCAGCTVTGFTVYSPTNSDGTSNTITSARFFYSSDLSKEDYSQDFDMSKVAYGENQVAMETPYTITGEESSLFFGYSVVVKKNMYYIPIDYVINEEYTGLCGTTNDDSMPAEFMSFAPYYGALSMSIKLEGDNLPENIASITTVDNPAYLPISGDGVNVDFIVKNMGANELSSVEVTASVTGMPDLVQTFDFTPLPYGTKEILTFNGIKANSEAFVDFSLQVTKVNGVEFDGQKVTSSVPAYDNGFVRKIVAEDATGTWCGYCPGGIEALDYLKANYPDRAIAIGVHCSNGASAIDPMEINEYLKFVSNYVSGFPTVLYNRTISQTPTSPYTQVCDFVDQVAAYYDSPSYAEVTLNGVSSEDGKNASVTASAEFKIATSVPHYLSFVIVEDGVGPYMQANYFKQQRIPMNGWETKNAKVSTIFNDVARYYNCYPGIKNSLPASIEANSVNEYSVELPLSNVTGNEYRVVALLTNAVTGEIVNAAQHSMSKDNNVSAVEVIDAYAPVEYYNLNGQKVANPSDGIFIRRQGGNATKVIIR